MKKTFIRTPLTPHQNPKLTQIHTNPTLTAVTASSSLSITISAPEIVGIGRTIRLCAKILRILRQRHQPAIPTAIQGSRECLDIVSQDTRVPSLDMVLWARVRPVVRACWVRCWTLAKRFRRVASGSVGRKGGNGIVEVRNTVVAGVVWATLVRGAVDEIGRCVVADAWLTISILVVR